MKKNKKYYMSLNYPVQIEKVDEGYCAYIIMLRSCKAFGKTPEMALKELEAVKEGFFDVFRGLKQKEELEQFVVY